MQMNADWKYIYLGQTASNKLFFLITKGEKKDSKYNLSKTANVQAYCSNKLLAQFKLHLIVSREVKREKING